MKVMESYLNENFGGVKAKHSSHEVLQKWREVCSVVKNPKRRFPFTANLSKRYEADAMRKTNQVAKHGADALILDDTFSSIVAGVKWGCSAYIYNIQKFAEFQLKNVLPLIVYFSSACLTGNAQLTAVLLLILGALAKKPMSKRILSFFILMGLVFFLEIQVVEGRGLKAVSDVKASPSLTSFKEMFSAEKKVDPVLYTPPSAARPPHH
ncbi:hypothetical protein SLEP1_g11745 [Rubroshorea leprosula]|nr:hypothetical protein SLEP1_g11745 [Rubroshorea leprosula]